MSSQDTEAKRAAAGEGLLSGKSCYKGAMVETARHAAYSVDDALHSHL